VKAQPRDPQWTGRKVLFQRLDEFAGNLRRDLVLDRDVRSPATRILRAQQPVKVVGQRRPKSVEVIGNDAESDARLADAVAAWLADNWDPELTVDEWWCRVAAAGWTVPHFTWPDVKHDPQKVVNDTLAILRDAGYMFRR